MCLICVQQTIEALDNFEKKHGIRERAMLLKMMANQPWSPEDRQDHPQMFEYFKDEQYRLARQL